MEVPQRGMRLPAGRLFKALVGLLSRHARWAGLAALLVWAGAALAASFIYDANGRLIAATNDAGATARYHYDPLGNISRIERLQPSDLAIFDFSPSHGGPGDLVRISGQGFSPTAVQNAVAFNGVAAPVSAASAQALTVAVPSGATTGPLSVSVGASSASSAVPFIVDAQGRLPVISSVAPLIASAGTAVTVAGQSLQPVAGQTSGRLGLRPVVMSQVSNTQLTFPVPTATGSGKVHVTTPYGTAISTEDVVVVPAGIDAADIAQAIRLAVDGSVHSMSVATVGQRVAVLLDAQGGDYISAQFSAMAAGAVDYALYGADNKRLAWGTVSATSPSFHLPRLKAAGTYLLLLTPTAAPLSWNLQLEQAAALAMDGALAEVTTTVAGQSKRLLLDAQQNVPLGLGLAEIANPVAWDTATVQVVAPDGSQAMLQHCNQKNNGCSLNLAGLQTGRHSVLVTPATAGTRLLGFQLALSTDATTSLIRNTAHALVLDRPGRNGRLRFTGNAGEVLGLLVAGQATSPSGRAVYYRIHGPDGAVWKSGVAVAGLTMNLSLPATGEYQLFVDAEFAETLQAQVTLSSGGSGPVPDGAAQPLLTTAPGQGVHFSFLAGSGQSLGLGISALTVNNGTAAAVNVYRPDGSLLANTTCRAANDGCDVNLPALSAGIHGVEILPVSDTQTMTFNATLSTDVAQILPRHVATPLALSRRGQNARLSFTATAGEVIALKIAGQATTPANRGVYYRAYHPDGSTIASGYASTEKTLLIDAPVAGTYQVFVDPEHGATASASLLLEAGALGEMEPDGSIGQYQSAAGANVSFTITASAGKHAGFGISHLALNTGTYVRVYAYAPNGATVGDEYCYVTNGGCDIDFYNPVSGIYSIVVKPVSATQTMKFRATQSSNLATTLSRNSPYSMSLDRRGQDGLMSFEGTAGETVALQIAGQATLPAGKTVKYHVYKPSERRITYQLTTLTPATGGAVNLSLPETGTYWIWADPEHGAAAAAQVTLSTGTTSGMVQDGASAAFAAIQPGQSAHFRVEAMAGRHLGFAISSLVINAGDHVRVYAYAPNGAAIGDEYCYTANDGCDIDIYNPVSGTYSIVVVPSVAGQLMQFTSTLSSNAPGLLMPDAPILLDLGRRGQDGLLTFSGTKGQTVALRVAGQSSLPARRSVKYQVYKPSERRNTYAVASINLVSGGALNLVLPETGTYWVWADPEQGAASTAQVTLSTGTSDGLALNGPAVLVETALPGQTAYFSFNAAAGQHLGFAVSDLVLSSDAYVRIYAYAPNGSSLGDDNYCYAANGGCDIDIYNAVAGTYSVLLVPFGLDQAMQFSATLTTSLPTTLARDVPLTLELERRGQDAVMKFEGTAGETVALLVGNQSSVPASKAVKYQVYKPSERRANYAMASINPTSGGAVNLMLPETGTYWVWADPEHGATATAQLALSTGATSSMVKDGALATFNSTLPGQPAHFRFEAVAGQHMGFALSDLAVSSGSDVRIYAFAPSGAGLGDSTYCEVVRGGCDIDIYNPVAGTYSVLVLPNPQAQMMQFSATLSSNIAAGLVRGAPLAVDLGRRGQDGMLTFSGTQGEKVTLQVVGQSSVPAASPVRYQVYKPSDRRSGYAIGSINPTTVGTLNLTLPETGTYWIWMDPDRGSSATSTITLTSTP